jgi:TolB-like protein/Tfp pilus assembly protein PilF
MMRGTRVFISYSHDSSEHKQRVLRLAQQLRMDGFDAQLDQYLNGSPEEGWPRWMLNQVDEAPFVLVVCTRVYYHRFRGREEPRAGRGSDWEGAAIIQQLYDQRSRTSKFIPVLFAPEDEAYVPEPLRGRTVYQLSDDLPDEEQYQKLADCLRGKAGVAPVPLADDQSRPERVSLRPPKRLGGVLPFGVPQRRLLMPLGVAGALAIGGTAYTVLKPDPAQASVALLPLDNLDKNDDQSWFPHAFTEELIGTLSKVDKLETRPPSSVRRYRGVQYRVPEVARQLNVAHILEGSVRRDGDSLRLHLALSNRNEKQIWAHVYVVSYSRRQDVQRRIAEDVAAKLGVKVSADSQDRLGDLPTDNLRAEDLYLQGREHLYREMARQTGNDSAAMYFQGALKLDPQYGLAYAGLARAYQERSRRAGMEAWYDSAVVAAQRAVELAPREERAHAALGYVLRAGGRLSEAKEVLLRAAKLTRSGNDASGLSNLGLVYVQLGRPDSAIHWHRRATLLEPTSWMARQRLGMAFEALGDTEGAEREYRAAIEIDSSAAEPRFQLAELYRMQGRAGDGEPHVREMTRGGRGWLLLFQWDAQNGRWGAALQAWTRWAANDGQGLVSVPPLLALAFLQAGDVESARAVLARVENEQQHHIMSRHEGYSPHLVLAQVYALRGNVPEANRYFSNAVRLGYFNVLEAGTLPTLATLRGTPEFRASLDRMATAAAHLRSQLR